MKKILFGLALFAATIVHGQSKSEAGLQAAVNAFNQALVSEDSVVLTGLCSASLTYGHSNGKVESRQEFLNTVLRGPVKFQSFILSGQTISLQKGVGIVRHIFAAKATNNGTPTDINLGVLQVWQYAHHHWQLLARQAVKK